jgi:tetratricopeptide (TPR) repeat protein
MTDATRTSDTIKDAFAQTYEELSCDPFEHDSYTIEELAFEPSVWLGHQLEGSGEAYQPASVLSANDLRNLQTIVKKKRVSPSNVPTTFLSKKADAPQQCPRKQDDGPVEKEHPKTGATLSESLVFGAFLIYVLLASIGMIKVDPSKLLGPALSGGKMQLTSQQMHARNAEKAKQQLDTARNLANEGNQAEAYKAVDTALQLSPSSEGYIQRARMQLSAGYVNSAINDFDRAIEISPAPALIYERGLAHMSAKNMRKATADFSRIIKAGASTDMFRIYAFRGRAFAEMRKYREAVNDYTKSISIAPTEATLEVTGYRNELKNCLNKVRHRV